MGFGGQAALVTSFIIRLQIHELEPLNVEVLASREEPHVLLGRDVLNSQRIVPMGRNWSWRSVEMPRADTREWQRPP